MCHLLRPPGGVKGGYRGYRRCHHRVPFSGSPPHWRGEHETHALIRRGRAWIIRLCCQNQCLAGSQNSFSSSTVSSDCLQIKKGKHAFETSGIRTSLSIFRASIKVEIKVCQTNQYPHMYGQDTAIFGTARVRAVPTRRWPTSTLLRVAVIIRVNQLRSELKGAFSVAPDQTQTCTYFACIYLQKRELARQTKRTQSASAMKMVGQCSKLLGYYRFPPQQTQLLVAMVEDINILR